MSGKLNYIVKIGSKDEKGSIQDSSVVETSDRRCTVCCQGTQWGRKETTFKRVFSSVYFHVFNAKVQF